MSEYAPPSGPPPSSAPAVPSGWKAIWNPQYSEWFYVNTYTKQSQWDKPTEAVHDPNDPYAPTGPLSHFSNSQQSEALPGYSAGTNAPVNAGTDTKQPIHNNSSYPSDIKETDEEMARRLQAQETAHHTSAGPGHATDRGTNDNYYNNSYQNAPGYGQQYPQQDYNQQQGYGQQSYNQQQQQSHYQQSSQQPLSPSTEQSRGKSGGFLSKLKEKIGNPPGHGSRPMGAPMMGYNAGGYPSQQQHGYGGYPQQRFGQQPMYGVPHKKKGMGAGGAAALGVGGGLIGGALLMNGMDDMQDNAYDQGFDDGGDFGGGDF